MRNYGVTVSDILAAIRSNRKAIAFWSGTAVTVSDGKRMEIIASHTDNVRDLRIMLLSVRFPENTFPAFSYGEGFQPVIVATDDATDNDNDNDNDATDATDATENSESTAELISA